MEYKITEYKILSDTNPKELEDLVNRYLADGWELAGGVCVRTQQSGDWTYYQAIKR